MGLAFAASPDVFTAELDGLLIALDLRTEAYYVFDEVATSMWEALVELGERDAALARVSARYDAAPERIAADLDALIARLVDGGFARRSPAPAQPQANVATAAQAKRRRVRTVSTARAWSHLAGTVLRLRRHGIAAAYRRSVALTAVEQAPAETLDVLLDRALRAFGRAENAFAIRRAPRDCFPRSIALFSFLRELGIPAEHRIGIDRYPFRAHAWVEYGGRVLADHAGNGAVFTTIARIAG